MAATFTVILADVELGQDQAAGVVERGEEVDLATAYAGGSTQALAVDGDPAQIGGLRNCVVAVGEPASDGLIEGIAVDAGKDPAQGRLSGHRVVPCQHVERSAEGGPDGLRGVGGPFADRQERGRAGQYGRGSRREDVDQGVPYPASGSRVGDCGQTFQQARMFGRLRGRLIAELVKKRDQGGCRCRHGLP
jgi:hypothetical protein